jgi:hypothetical protein
MKKNARFINTERIEGYVYSTGSNFNQLSERTTGENSKHPGTKYIAGDLDIAVDEEGLNVITIHYTYATPTYGSGQVNNTYTALKRIIDNPDRTWINGGKENAFKVQCTGVSIAINDFIGADGKFVAAIRNEGGFCSIVNELGPEANRNTFSADMLITKVTHIDADPDKNIENDFTTVSGAIFGYGKTIPVLLPASFTVRSEGGMKYFENLDATPSDPIFTKVWGRINCMTIKVKKTEESAFGGDYVQESERKSREYLITGTAKVPYDFGDEEVLTANDVSTMNQNRQIMLAEVESRHKERQAEKAANGVSFEATTKTPAATKATGVPEGGFVF